MATLPMPEVQRAPSAGGPADVVYVLLLLQAAMGLLAVLGLVVIMGGNPVYTVVPSIKPVLLLVLARGVARGWRRAPGFVIAVETVSLAGYFLNLLIGFLPQADVTVNLVTVLSNVALPLALIVLCARLRPRQVSAG
ncbi:MAG TPA: hypothetical protein VKE25_03110 [Actinomycetes bacterium]|nr:hypothetical protein [Actinomycetes bacterium]